MKPITFYCYERRSFCLIPWDLLNKYPNSLPTQKAIQAETQNNYDVVLPVTQTTLLQILDFFETDHWEKPFSYSNKMTIIQTDDNISNFEDVCSFLNLPFDQYVIDEEQYELDREIEDDFKIYCEESSEDENEDWYDIMELAELHEDLEITVNKGYPGGEWTMKRIREVGRANPRAWDKFYARI